MTLSATSTKFTRVKRLILNRIISMVDENLIKEQAGFRPRKFYTSQVLHLTQHIIKDGFKLFKAKKVTGIVFVYLSAPYYYTCLLTTGG